MLRRLITLAFFALVALVAVLAALGANTQPRVTEATGAGFPSRSYILTLPHGMQLKNGAVHAFENGQQVPDLTVTPVGESKSRQFGAVLVVDASTSMEGTPERAAFSAARAFAAQRKGQEQLALVTYNVAPTVVLPFTTEQTQIDAALSRQPPFLFGTHIYDAITHSLDLLQAAHISAGTIVVLSDGQEHAAPNDTAAHETEESAATAARAAHVRVFAVGLKSRVSKLGALRKLARDTGGRYVETTSIQQLSGIYKQLGTSLASEYLLRYRSLAAPDKHIVVTFRIDGLKAIARAEYQTPALAVATKTPRAPYKPSAVDRFLSSAATMTFVGLIVAILIGFGAATLLSRPRQGTVRKRLAEFVSVPAAMRDTSRRPTAQLTEKMLEGTESMLRGSTRWQRFKWELGIAGVTMPSEQIVALTAIGSLLAALMIKVLFNQLIIGLLLALVIPFAVRSVVQRRLAKQRKLFAEQLGDNLQVLASALRAGHSFIGALAVVANDAAEPSRSEFQRVIGDEQLGVPIDQALHVVVERMESRELEQVALVAALQREAGGNTAEVLDRVTATIRERFELRRTVQTLTAQGRMSRWVLTLLPVFLLIAITLINPGYMNVMYDSSFGRVLLFLSAVSIASGSLVIKRIVNIRV
jgi:tight adherence protein B